MYAIRSYYGSGTTMDNLDCQPDLVFTGNRVANNRARSLIFSTQGKVLIADNHFDQPVNEAIKVLGDANFWFESGPVSDVTIKNNVFISRSPECPVFEFGPEEDGLPEMANVPRITSYNVCYTKLLRSVLEINSGNYFSGKHRITSYNVCYTKLLRVKVDY